MRCVGDPAAAPSAGRAQAADARVAVGPSDGGAGALAADCRPSSTRPSPPPAPSSTPWSRRNSIASLCGLVAAGTGWSLVDRLSAESFSHLGLVARPFEPAILYESASSIAAIASLRCWPPPSSNCSSGKLGALMSDRAAISTPGSPPNSRRTPACGATSTTSAIAAAGSPAPRARNALSRSCASGCAPPRRPMPAVRSPCPMAAGAAKTASLRLADGDARAVPSAGAHDRHAAGRPQRPR